MNIPVDGLTLPTLALLQALPRGRRFSADDLRRAATSLAMKQQSAKQRLNALVKAGRVTVHAVWDTGNRNIGTEWEVRS